MEKYSYKVIEGTVTISVTKNHGVKMECNKKGCKVDGWFTPGDLNEWEGESYAKGCLLGHCYKQDCMKK